MNMMKFQQRFADDEDILKAIAGAADALYDIYRENQVPGRRRKLLKDMEERNVEVFKEHLKEHLLWSLNIIKKHARL